MSPAGINFWTSLVDRIAPKSNRLPGIERREEDENDRSVPHLLRWRQSFDVMRKEWLILGKGPSYAQLARPQLDNYFTCSLNHVVREHPVDLAQPSILTSRGIA